MSADKCKEPKLVRVKVENIQQLTPRVRLYIDEDYLSRLIKDIQRHGIQQPPVLKYMGNDKYSPIDGWHRIEAAKRLGIKEIDAYVYYSEEIDPFIEGLRRNTFQKTLDPISIAYGIRELVNRGLSWKQIEELTGFSEKHCRRYLKLLQLPKEVQDKIGRGEIAPFGKEVARYLKGQNVPSKPKKPSNGVRCPICGCFPEKGKGKWIWICEDHLDIYNLTIKWLNTGAYKTFMSSISLHPETQETTPASISLLPFISTINAH